MTNGNERKLRYPDSPDMQYWWEGLMRDNLNYEENLILFYEDFLRRHWADYEIVRMVRGVLRSLNMKRKRICIALERGDYEEG